MGETKMRGIKNISFSNRWEDTPCVATVGEQDELPASCSRFEVATELLYASGLFFLVVNGVVSAIISSRPNGA